MQFIRKLFGFSLGPILGAIISFVTVPLTTYFINPGEYGKTSLFTMIQSILMVVTYLGMDQVFVREYHEENKKVKMLTNCIFVPFILSLLLIFLSPLFSKNLSIWMFGEENREVIYVLAITIPFLVIERFILISIRMEEKALLYSTITVSIKIVILVLTFIFIFFIRRDYLAIVYSTLIGQIISDLLIFIKYHDKIKINLSCIDFNTIIRYLKYGIPLALSAVIGYLLNSTDKIFLRYFSTYEELGYYSVAMRVASLLLIIQNSFCAFWTPVALRWRHENKNDEYYEIVNRLLSLAMSLLFLFILTFKFLLPIIFSSNYSNSIKIIPFLLFYPMMSILSSTTELGIQFTKKSYITVISTVISLSINIVLDYFLVPVYDAVGASIATGISYIVFFWIRTIASRKLWFKFNVNHLIYITCILFFSSLVSTIIDNQIIIIFVNLIFSILICFIYRNDLEKIISFIVNLKK